MDFSVLGPLRVSGAHGPVEVTGSKERTLLAHLVASAGHVVPVSALVDALWGDAPPRTATKSLQTYVLRLRNSLEPGRDGTPSLLLTEGTGYRLAIAAEAVDAGRFARLVTLGRRALADGRPQAAAATLRDALALWRGAAYAGFEHTAFGSSEGRRLEELRLVAIEERWAAELAADGGGAAVPELEALVAAHPLRERLWGLLVLALYRSGRQGEALGAFERARRVLADELGIDPGPELRVLHTRVLAQDAGLQARPHRSALPVALATPPGPLLGRHEELARLRIVWERAQAGERVLVAVRGPRGAGATRLAAALADDVARAGGQVLHLDGPARDVDADGHAPALVVVDGGGPLEPQPSWLVLHLLDERVPVPHGAELLDLAPLDGVDLRALVEQYVEPDQVERVVAEVAERSGGWPGPAVDAAMVCARALTTARVGTAAVQADRSQAALHAARRELTDGLLALTDEAPPRALADPHVCPWRGLEAYDVTDAPWFAGRERLVAELVSRLSGSRLLAVVGPSGSGKSSVVRAGLLAALADDVLPGSAAWTPIVLRPGGHPMRTLALAALDRPAAEVGEVLEQLVRATSEASVARQLLVVDQLEEVWTACGDAAERTTFLDTLVELAQDPCSVVTVVLVVRADYVGHLAEHPELAGALRDAALLVGSPTPREVRRAVERPARRAGLRLDDGLADALVSDAGAEPGLLPLLSTALTQLWRARSGGDLTFAAYVGAGGLSGAIAHLAEQTYERLDVADRDAVRVLLLRLAGPGEGTAVTRRRAALAELEALPSRDVRRVVDDLAEARLLTLSDGTVEVAHEALFREWPRLRGWLAEDVAGRDVQRRLALAATEWAAEAEDATLLWRGTRLEAALEVARVRPEELTPTEHEFLDASDAAVEAERTAFELRAAGAARQNRRLRRLLSATAVLLVLAVLAGVLAVRSRQEATAAGAAAEAKRLAASALNLEAPDLALLAAVEATHAEDSPETWGALLTLLVRQPDVVMRVRTDDRFLDMDVTPDGRIAVLGEDRPRYRGLDTVTGEVLWDLPAPGEAQVFGIAAVPDGSGVLVSLLSDEEPALALVDPTDGNLLWRTGRREVLAVAGPDADPYVMPVGVRGDGRAVFATSSHVLSADPQTGAVLDAVPWPRPMPFTPSFFVWPDGRVSVEDPDDAAKGLVFDPARPGLGLRSTPGAPLAVSPDGEVALVGRQEPGVALVQLLDTSTLEPTSGAFVIGEQSPRTAQWSADGSQLVLTADAVVELRDGRTGALQRQMRAHSSEIMSARYAGPDRDLVWTASRDGTAAALDLSGRRTVVRQHTGSAATYGLAAGGDATIGAYLDAPDGVFGAALIDLQTGRGLGPLPLDEQACRRCGVGAVAVTPDGSRALGGVAHLHEDASKPADTGSLAVWRTADRTLERVVPLPWPVYGVGAAPDGRRTVVNGRFGFGVVDVQRRAAVVGLHDDAEQRWYEGLVGAEVSPDGRRAAVGRRDEVVVLDMATGAVVRRTRVVEDGRYVQALAWSPDSRALVVGSEIGHVSVLDAGSLAPLAPRRLVSDGWVLDLAFSRDGRVLASIGIDGDTTLWDTAAWQPLGQPVTDGRAFGWLWFPPDGERLRAFFQDRSTADVDIRRETWRRAACAAAGRDLSEEESALLRPGRGRRTTCPRTS